MSVLAVSPLFAIINSYQINSSEVIQCKLQTVSLIVSENTNDC